MDSNINLSLTQDDMRIVLRTITLPQRDIINIFSKLNEDNKERCLRYQSITNVTLTNLLPIVKKLNSPDIKTAFVKFNAVSKNWWKDHWNELDTYMKIQACISRSIPEELIEKHWHVFDVNGKGSILRYSNLSNDFIRRHWKSILLLDKILKSHEKKLPPDLAYNLLSDIVTHEQSLDEADVELFLAKQKKVLSTAPKEMLPKYLASSNKVIRDWASKLMKEHETCTEV